MTTNEFLSLNDLTVSYNDASKHTIVFGRPGSGKSLFFSSLLKELKTKNLKFIVFDFKNDFVRKHYDNSIHRHNSPSQEELSIEAMKLWFRNPTNQISGIFLSGQTSKSYLESAIQHLCSLSDDSNYPVHFLLDELVQANISFNSLLTLLTQGRSKGANVWLSCISYDQLINHYSKIEAESILNVINNYCAFAIGDDATAKMLVSKLPGISSNDLANLPALSYYAKFGTNSTVSLKVPL